MLDVLASVCFNWVDGSQEIFSAFVSCTPMAARLSLGARMMAVQRSLMMPTFCGTCSPSACRGNFNHPVQFSPAVPQQPDFYQCKQLGVQLLQKASSQRAGAGLRI